MEVKLTFPEAVYNLVLNGKFNVIIGDSGTGKTRLARIIARHQNSKRVYMQHPIIPISTNWQEHIDTPTPRLIVIDEDETGVSQMIIKYMKAMQQSCHYFIICMRDGTSLVPYGLNTTFILTGDTKVYNMELAYKDAPLTRNLSGRNVAVCEDSKLGFQLLGLLCKHSGVSILSADGRGTLVKMLGQNNFGVAPCAVFDSCGIGPHLKTLLDLAVSRRCIAFDTPSLEHEIGVGLFGEEAMKYHSSQHALYPSEEAFYESKLSELLAAYGVSYSKSSDALATLLANGKGMLHDGFHDLRAEGLDVTKIYPEFRKLNEGD